MLTSLEIENFKGIAARQRIDFAPLTLLFGANSAGKSTVLQALLYLHELIERGSADVDRTELGGNVLELGGFARLVHRHETERAIVLRAEFATPGALERFGRDLSDFPFPDFDDMIETAWLELEVRYRRTPTFRGPIIDRVTIGANGISEPLVRMANGESLRAGEPLYVQVNLGHPVVATLRTSHPHLWPALEAGHPWLDIDDLLQEERHQFEATIDELSAVAVSQDLLARALGKEAEFANKADLRWRPFFAIARSRAGALPGFSEALRVLPAGDIEGDKEELVSLRRQPSFDKKRVEALEQSISARERAAQHVRTFLEMVVLGTTAQLAAFLRDAQYIGPLRTIPPRGFLYERAGRITNWADGLAAWDLLLADRLTLIERTNAWLRRLGAGCQVVVQQLFEGNADAEDLSGGHVDKTVRRLLLDTGAGSFVLPSEVGAGISQLIPVIVAAIEGRGGLTLVEQPEIHVHPAVQVGLGDLLIEAASREGSRRTLLVETHSEHLILRLLRRIRETTEKELAEDAPAFSEDKLSVLYVEANPGGVRVRRLRVDERGEFVDRWPKGFFAERMEELL
ncbi:AAA family ATPase [Myxococcus sp. XM-1-1-1]|uniref:AAA family ATPase n=1 Tax=Myxococcus sp. XM-1-1-1 TaxID=2874602 RepID=UPI001CC1A840|nr:AAA family ATPase [Myxococcus sp. XM-1-1-1]MBZ4414689.1 AAA family ATPase [Myxococcus sp. XM-1-1-1]